MAALGRAIEVNRPTKRRRAELENDHSVLDADQALDAVQRPNSPEKSNCRLRALPYDPTFYLFWAALAYTSEPAVDCRPVNNG